MGLPPRIDNTGWPTDMNSDVAGEHLEKQTLGRMGGPLAAGPDGTCVCPNCAAVAPHKTGAPCTETPCPFCGSMMVRQTESEA